MTTHPAPADGTPIGFAGGKLKVPADPVIPIIPGDGIGPDITRAMRRVVEAAVERAFKGQRRIAWFELPAGETALKAGLEALPDSTLDALQKYRVSIKGPLTTPVGGGYRSLNVTIRQKLELYACVRPVRWVRGVPSPVRRPQDLDVVIFRENTEDVYAGIEWPAGSPEAEKLRAFLAESLATRVRERSGIGVKPISELGTKRLVRAAISYALERGRRRVTLVHKGNIMKFTEGAFRDWGYELAAEEFANETLLESDWDGGEVPKGKVLVNDRIADSMFQQVLLRPAEYDVVATPNLNGDYLSDACAAQVGGLGLAPGANVGDGVAVFEATHGTAPKYAGLDKVNPGSLILSAVMMLEHLGWRRAARLVERALARTVRARVVTYDLARQMKNATEVATSAFAEAMVERM